MAGEATWLNAAAAATPTPVTAANTALPPTVATARRPGTPRSLWLTMLNRSLAAPQCAMSMPITVKQGMTTKLYSLMPDSADCCSRLIIGSRPPSAKYRPSAPAAANAKTMGTPTTMRTSSAMRPLHISNGMFRLLPILLRPLFFRGAHRSTFAFGCGMGASGRPCGADAATRALGDKADAHQRGHHPQHDGAESQRPGGDAHGVVAEEFAAAPACERWLPGDEHHGAEERGAQQVGEGVEQAAHCRRHALQEERDAQQPALAEHLRRLQEGGDEEQAAVGDEVGGLHEGQQHQPHGDQFGAAREGLVEQQAARYVAANHQRQDDQHDGTRHMQPQQGSIGPGFHRMSFFSFRFSRLRCWRCAGPRAERTCLRPRPVAPPPCLAGPVAFGAAHDGAAWVPLRTDSRSGTCSPLRS